MKGVTVGDAVAAPGAALTQGTPQWWLKRLDDELQRRSLDMQAYRNLVDDVHAVPDSQEQSRKFARMAGLATTNLTGLAVEATAERMSVEGVRIGDQPDADKDVWDNIWQRSDFDAGSQDAITAALVYGRSFVSVSPPGDDGFARLNYEDPRQVVVATNADGQRVAALKVFADEWTGTHFATLYLPTVIAKLQATSAPSGDLARQWTLRDLALNGSDNVIANPFGEIPFFELQNKLSGSVRSEVAPLVIPQRLLNQTMFNIEAIAEYGAFRQKWATGIEVPRDPVTGQPVAPYEAHIAKLFAAEGPDARFGDFNASDLGPHIDFAREIAASISRLSRVPITYFLSNVSNLSADALALLVSGLVLKCRRRVKGYEPGLEGAVQLALRAQGDARANVANIELKWASMETRSVAQDADAAVKLTQGDNPVLTPQTAQEKYLGMSQTERDRDAAWRLENGATGNLAALFSSPTTPAA